MEASKRPSQRAHGQKLTRKRLPLSCNACRIRKLKCNREKPCQNCIVRGDPAIATCTYAEKPSIRNSGKSRGSDAADMRSRIGRLESSILSIMAEDDGQSASPVHPGRSISSDPGNDSDATGGPPISADSRSTHWDAILHEIGAMKDAWNEEYDQSSPISAATSSTITHAHRPSLLHGMSQPPDRSVIEADIPTKENCERLISHFFDSYSPAMPAKTAIHRPTVEKHLEEYFADPSRTKIIWVGFFFAIFCISLHSYVRQDEVYLAPAEYKGNIATSAELFRLRTAECLLISDITKPKDMLLETLILYSLIEYGHETDGAKGVMLLSNIMMRLALVQGYHREPDQHPNLTVFQKEMRRRIWAVVNQFELLFSAQLGIPKAIQYANCDTRLASNFHEDELSEDMEELPPARPLSERTEVCYQIVKAQIMKGYGQVVEFLHIVKPQPYSEVLRLDTMLLNCRDSFPHHLQLRPLNEMKGHPGPIIMERFILQQFFHKSICLLHRKYWKPSMNDNGESNFNYSQRASVASSIALLDNQAVMHEISKPGQPMEKLRWYDYAIINHDFLLAAMVLSLDLVCEQNESGIMDSVTGALPLNSRSCATPAEKVYALKRSLGIWIEVQGICADAKRAIQVLQSVLEKLRQKPEYMKIFGITPEPESQSSMSPVQLEFEVSPRNKTWSSDSYFPKPFDVKIESGLLPIVNTDYINGIPPANIYTSFGNVPFTAMNNLNSGVPTGVMSDPFLNGMEASVGFDWSNWDHFVYGNNVVPPGSSQQYDNGIYYT